MKKHITILSAVALSLALSAGNLAFAAGKTSASSTGMTSVPGGAEESPYADRDSSRTGRNVSYLDAIRFENRELDFKLPVNQQIKDYILAYLRRSNVALPEVTDFEPEAVADSNQWLLDHETQHSKYAMHKDEQVHMGDEKNYLKLRLQFPFGKIIYPATAVEDVLSLIMQEA